VLRYIFTHGCDGYLFDCPISHYLPPGSHSSIDSS
jgi:hypothetical protein